MVNPRNKRQQTGQIPADHDPIFFYMPDAARGEFCQWYSSELTVSKADMSNLVGHSVDEEDNEGSITFNCANQFRMYCKAGRFTDRATQQRILATSDPTEQKMLGKGVTGFNDAYWDEIKSDVVVAGNMAKFGQNKKLRGKLLATGDRMLVEAASKDRVWGIGYNARRAMEHRKTWGENRLGNALMVVRERLREEQKANSSEYDWATGVDERI